MEALTLTIIEFYSIFTLIFGNIDLKVKGFTNESEPGLKESTKRKVNKVGEIVKSQLTQIEEQRNKIKTYTEEGKTEEELATIRTTKEQELLLSKETIQIEKIPFALVENVSLSGNYQFLYDNIFKEN